MQFGVTRHLIGNYVRHGASDRAPAPDVTAPWYSLQHSFVMERGEATAAEAADQRQGGWRTAADSAS